MEINFIPYKEIDKEKWDDCISRSNNRLIYCFSFYLDAIADNWDALISGDYKMVMPLIWKRKYGIKYLYQPAFHQQGGIFSRDGLPAEITEQFLQEARIRFRFAEFTTNHGNSLSKKAAIKRTTRRNFLLHLEKPYDQLFNRYTSGFRKSLRRIKKFNFSYRETGCYQTQINLYQKLYGKRLSNFKKRDYKNFELICATLAMQERVLVREVYSVKDELLASCVLLIDQNRFYNIISCVTTEGRKLEANYFLYDEIIKELGNRNAFLDMEGSDEPGIAAFYEKLSPQEEQYYFVRWNDLPSPFNRLKPRA